MFNFKDELYPKSISYVNHNSLFQYLADQDSIKYFFRFLSKKLIAKYENGINLVVENQSDKMTLIDINYNFFIECLGEWCEHYSSNKTILTKYNKYKTTKNENEKGEKIDEEKTLKWIKNYEIEMSIKERIQFDYAYSGWMISNGFHKKMRFNFVQVFLNSMIAKVAYVRNFSRRMYAIPVTKMLVQDSRDVMNNQYNIHAVTSFHRPFYQKIYLKKI